MLSLMLASTACFVFAPVIRGQTGAVQRLEVFPAERILHAPHNTQQLAVIAHFADGSTRDVTQLTQFTSDDLEIAAVDRKARVTFAKGGEVAIFCRYQKVQAIRLAYADRKPGYVWPNPPENNLIDHLVFKKLKELAIRPSDLCTDEVFLRRAYLDVCGMLPTPREAKRFLDDARANKRSLLIDELLARSEYAELWAHHWADLMELPLRNADVRLGAAYVHWLRGHVRQNTPLDRMVRDVLLGNGAVTAVGPANYYTRATDQDDIAARTAESFLGIRLQCMMCHVHFTANFKGEDWHGFAAFFSQVKQKHATFGKLTIANVVMDLKNERLDRVTLKSITPRFPDGTTPSLKPLQDRREVLAEWLTSPTNLYFARTLVNYIWRGLVGKGFTDAPEKLHEAPFTTNDAVLDALAKEMVTSRFDGKQMIRIIMNSRVYQLAPQADDFNKHDQRFFSRGYPRRVQSEVFNDMLTQLLEDVEEFDKMPPGTKAIHLLQRSYHLSTFSRPQRISACECEKTREPNLASMLHELNSERIQRRLKARNRIDRLIAEKKTDREMLDDIILTAFSRMPANDSYKMALAHVSKAPSRRQGWEDVLWAVMNTREFLFRP